MSARTTPFQIGEEVEYYRQIVASPTEIGSTGKVVAFRFPEKQSAFGPVVVYVDLDNGREQVPFHADELRRPAPAPSDDTTPALVALDRSEAETRVLKASLAWHAADGADLAGLRETFWALKDAIRDYAEVTR